MKRKFMLLLLVCVMIATCLASCEEECKHVFSEKWVNDNPIGHWHRALCEHGEIRDSFAPHEDNDKNGTCDVCGFDMTHEHTFADEWISTETHHWREATCAHTEEKGEYDLHSDLNLDTECDYCSAHVHLMNIIGRCSGCNVLLKEVENMDIAMAIYTASESRDFVNGGNVDYEFIGRSNSGAEFESKMLQFAEYIYGEGYTYVKSEYDTTVGGNNEIGTKEGWYEVDGKGVFGVVKNDGGDFELDSASANSLLGFYFALSTFADGYGPEGLLYNLFEISQAANSSDFEYVMGNNTAAFSFNNRFTKIEVSNTTAGKVTNINYFVVRVEFDFTDDYAITNLDVVVNVYTNDPGSTDDGLLEDDVDLDYDEATGKVTLRENALADTYTISAVQEIGDRTAVNPYPKSYFVPESFDIFADENCIDHIDNSISVNVYSISYIYIGNYRPEGTSLDYVSEYITFEVYDGNGRLIEDAGDIQNGQTFRASFVYDESGRFFFFVPRVEDTYTFVIYFMGNKTHEVTIYAGVKADDEVQVGKNQFAVKINEAYGWTANEVSFTATTAGTYTFTFTDNLSFINADAFDAAFDKDGYLIADEEPDAYYDYQDPDTEKTFSFQLELGANETIRFYTSSDVAGTYVVTYSIK